jgi:tetratricopeptide (TPR) repeat protein
MASINYNLAVKEAPESKPLLRLLALTLEAMASYKEASNYWTRIYQLDPMDSEARSKITQLGAMEVMDRGGVEDAESTQDVKHKSSAYDDFDPGAQRGKQEVLGPGMSAEADLQRAIRKNPEKVEAYVQLGEFYTKQKNYAQAFEILQQAVEVSGGDANIREMLEDVEIEQLKQNYDLAKKTAAQEPDDEVHKENVQALLQELLKRQLQVLYSRVERYPKDSKLRLELGEKLYRVKQFEKAIPHLQRASGDQRLIADVNLLLGKCFYSVKKYGLAINSLKKALPAINPIDRTDQFCEAHYMLGFLSEMQKDFAAAEQHYQEVIGVDYEYRDTLDRLEKIQSRVKEA